MMFCVFILLIRCLIIKIDDFKKVKECIMWSFYICLIFYDECMINNGCNLCICVYVNKRLIRWFKCF